MKFLVAYVNVNKNENSEVIEAENALHAEEIFKELNCNTITAIEPISEEVFANIGIFQPVTLNYYSEFLLKKSSNGSLMKEYFYVDEATEPKQLILKSQYAERLVSTYNLFANLECEKYIESRIVLSKEVTENYIKKLLRSKLKESEYSQISKIEVTVHVNEDSAHTEVEIFNLEGDSLVLEVCRYTSSEDAWSDAPDSWDWARMFMDTDSPYYSDKFISGYCFDNCSIAIEQFSQCLDEQDLSMIVTEIKDTLITGDTYDNAS